MTSSAAESTPDCRRETKVISGIGGIGGGSEGGGAILTPVPIRLSTPLLIVVSVKLEPDRSISIPVGALSVGIGGGGPVGRPIEDAVVAANDRDDPGGVPGGSPIDLSEAPSGGGPGGSPIDDA